MLEPAAYPKAQDLAAAIQHAKSRLAEAQASHARYANQSRQDMQFRVSDLVQLATTNLSLAFTVSEQEAH